MKREHYWRIEINGTERHAVVIGELDRFIATTPTKKLPKHIVHNNRLMERTETPRGVNYKIFRGRFRKWEQE